MCLEHGSVGMRLAMCFSREKLCAMPAETQSLGFMINIKCHYDCSILDCSGKIGCVA